MNEPTLLGTAPAITLAPVTLVWRDWIKPMRGLDPDLHSGRVQSLVVVALGACPVVVGFVAPSEWRRARSAPSTSA